MSSKRQKRISASAEEYAEQISQISAAQNIQSRIDSELFTVDRSGSQSQRKRIAKEIKVKSDDRTGLQKIVSVTERTLIKRILAKGPKIIKDKETEKDLSDLWEVNDTPNVVDTSVLTRSRKSRSQNLLNAKINVAIRGQSYNPSHSDHQDALAEALAVEIRKREHDLKTKGAWDTSSLSELTRSVTRTDDSGSDDDEENDEEGMPTNRKRKREKMTRAQINKKKARNIATFEEIKKKEEKDLLRSIDALPRHLKNQEAKEKRQADMKLIREAQKKDTSERDAMSYEEAALVPLSDELQGSLRRITPKGCNIRDHQRNMRTNGDLSLRDRRKRTTFEKPHGSKNIKWFAKYKYV